jgi:catalase-peroxidase
MAWHSAGTYRIADGRGGAAAAAALRAAQQLARQRQPRQGAPPAVADQAEVRAEDLVGRPDGAAGNVALESMGFKTFGFAGGREGRLGAGHGVLGPEKKWLGDERYSGDRELAEPAGAVQMGLIYVNPEGPNGNPDPLAAAATSARPSAAWR